MNKINQNNKTFFRATVVSLVNIQSKTKNVALIKNFPFELIKNKFYIIIKSYTKVNKLVNLFSTKAKTILVFATGKFSRDKSREIPVFGKSRFPGNEFRDPGKF